MIEILDHVVNADIRKKAAKRFKEKVLLSF